MTPEQRAELERTSTLFHGALVQLGAATTTGSLGLWEEMPPLPSTQSPRLTERWLKMAIRFVMRRRIRARDLALAYYRYQRAVATGHTVALPGRDEPAKISVFVLRDEFEGLLNLEDGDSEDLDENAPVGASGADVDEETLEVSEAPETPRNDTEAPSEGDLIILEQIEGLEALFAELDREAEEQIEEVLRTLGPANLDRKLRAEPEAGEVAHKQAGNRQAATSARAAMDGARGTLTSIGTKDKRALGYVRVSKTGTPCGWCAMLISRGFIPTSRALYKSDQGSGEQADGTIVTFGDLDLYHDNCQCYAVPIYSREQLNGDQFAINREYASLWPVVTKGLRGKQALTAWRLFFREQAKSQKSLEAAA